MAAAQPHYDLVIRGGLVFDGSGAEGVRADVAIADGHAVAVATERDAALAPGTEEIDASGCWFSRSVDAKARPTAEELATMRRMLDEALDVGYVGLLAHTLPWDKREVTALARLFAFVVSCLPLSRSARPFGMLAGR